MTLKIIKEGLSEDLLDQLRDNEKVYYFSYISTKGGCSGSSDREEYWIALTNKRVIYKAKVVENNKNKTTEKEGIIPLEKISFIEVSKYEDRSGCNKKQYYEIKINSSGGSTEIPVPTREKANKIKNIYQEIYEDSKTKSRQKKKD